jgi:predicted nucleotidyltransferase
VTLSSPLEDLISPEKALILTVLERTGQPLTGRTIAALTGTVSQSTTSRLLIQLGQRGLVMQVPGGYELNRDHLSYRAIEALLGARDELQRRVREDVNAWDSPPLSVILFGSAARRQDTPGSDIDLLVVRPTTVSFDDQRWAMNVANLSERVSRWCGSPCEVLEYSPDELAELTRIDDPLIASLIRDGITFVGADLDTLLHPVPR